MGHNHVKYTLSMHIAEGLFRKRLITEKELEKIRQKLAAVYQQVPC